MTQSDMAPASQPPGSQPLGTQPLGTQPLGTQVLSTQVLSTSAPGSPAPGEEHACAQAWAALTAAHALVSGQLSTALARACDLSINDFQILLRLDHVPAPGLRLTELNSAIPLTQPSLSRAVARLCQRGWLSRTGTQADRRGILITITPAGRDVLGQAIPVHAQTIREFLLDPLTPDELDLLARALSRVAEADTALKSR